MSPVGRPPRLCVNYIQLAPGSWGQQSAPTWRCSAAIHFPPRQSSITWATFRFPAEPTCGVGLPFLRSAATMNSNATTTMEKLRILGDWKNEANWLGWGNSRGSFQWVGQNWLGGGDFCRQGGGRKVNFSLYVHGRRLGLRKGRSKSISLSARLEGWLAGRSELSSGGRGNKGT